MLLLWCGDFNVMNMFVDDSTTIIPKLYALQKFFTLFRKKYYCFKVDFKENLNFYLYFQSDTGKDHKVYIVFNLYDNFESISLTKFRLLNFYKNIIESENVCFLFYCNSNFILMTPEQLVQEKKCIKLDKLGEFYDNYKKQND